MSVCLRRAKLRVCQFIEFVQFWFQPQGAVSLLVSVLSRSPHTREVLGSIHSGNDIYFPKQSSAQFVTKRLETNNVYLWKNERWTTADLLFWSGSSFDVQVDEPTDGQV